MRGSGVGVPEKRRERVGLKKTFKEIMTKNFQIWQDLQTQENERNPTWNEPKVIHVKTHHSQTS